MKYFVFALLLLSAIPAHARPAIDRVNARNTIHCGYVEYYPSQYKNTETNEWQGFTYEIVQAVANRLQLATNFGTPAGWGTVVADLNAGKYDMLCSGYWVHPNVGKFALFSRPFFFQPVFIVAREGDARFTLSTNLDDPALKMVALDGDNPIYIAKSDFPQAQIVTLPEMSDFSQVLVNVADGKADFTIVDAYTFGTYNKNNPGKLRIVAPDHPVRTYPSSFVFGADDYLLRDAFNAALDELILDGTIDRILDKYDHYPNAFYRAVVPYRNPYSNGN